MTDLEIQELESLQARAKLLGVSFHPSISATKLREKIAAHEASKGLDTEDKLDAGGEVETLHQKLVRLQAEASKLVRIRLTCMNPAKKEWPGEILTAGNAGVGSFKKFVPFNAGDDGWHVPQIIFQMLKDRMCTQFFTEKSKHGVNVRRSKLIKEFAIEVLPPLTQEELDELARRQAMAKSVG